MLKMLKMLVFCLLFTIFSLATRAHQATTDQRWSSNRGQESPASRALPRRIFSLADKRLVMSALSYFHGGFLEVKRLAMSTLCSPSHDNGRHLTAELMPASAPGNTPVEKRFVLAQSHARGRIVDDRKPLRIYFSSLRPSKA